MRTTNGFPTDVGTHQMALCPSQICSASAFAHTPGENILHDLGSRVRRLLETCNNHGLVPIGVGARAQASSVASLIFYANAKAG